jgi:predicted Ser/Thr protein kinase
MACPAPDVIERFASGDLSPGERGDLLDHAAGCPTCHAAIAVVITADSLPAGAVRPAAPAAPAQRIGRYTLGEVLGRGAMGVVHAARDPELDRDVAVKLLRSQASPARLRREAQALAKLAHPNVVRVYDVGDADGQTFIAMELVPGENLRQWLTTRRAVDEIITVLVKAGHGLAAAHAAGLVHRDFKPDNVLLASTGQVLVGDFGLARAAEGAPPSEDGAPAPVTAAAISSESLTATGTVVGTPAYMAPEQALGEATPAADQYAFCVTAWEALYGARPYAGLTLEEVRGNARAGRLVKPETSEVPKRVEEALRRGLARRPEARFPSMEALLLAIAPAPVHRRRWPWIAAGLAIAGGGVATAVVLAGGGGPRASCADAAALVEPAWSASTEDALARRFDRTTADTFGRYATGWQAARVEACRATHERGEQTADHLARRVACLDRARDELRLTIAAALASSPTELVNVRSVADALPSVERCETMPATAAPPAQVKRSIDELDAALAGLELSLASGTPSITLAMASDLRAAADALGYLPQRLHAHLLEARVAAWTGDVAAAETELRDVIVLAEEARDDFTRARAGASLAAVIAERRPDDAAQAVASARAALTRAGRDPTTERALLLAEGQIADARGDLPTARAMQERVIASLEAASGDPTDELVHAYLRLVSICGRSFDEPCRVATEKKAYALILARAQRNGEKPVDGYDQDDAMSAINAGDFTGAVAAAGRQLAAFRARPDAPAEIPAYIKATIALAYELDHEWTEALAAHRDAVAAWSLPFAMYGQNGVVDEKELRENRIDGMIGASMCLWRLGRYAEQLATLRDAEALVVAGGPAAAAMAPSVQRWLGISLVENGKPREARDLLEPIAAAIAEGATMPPYPRGITRFALARALWADGGLADRPRARALADDALGDFAEAIATADQSPSLRKLPPLARASSAEVTAWLDAHPVR